MSKKYVYFKCNAQAPHPFARDQLALLELNYPTEDLRPVQTIFQLMEHPDLKLIISKNESLQRRLASGLPQEGMHGFLWTGEHLPALLEKMMFHSMLTERIFIFQRNTDSAPTISDPIQPQLEIYNWWIFEYFTFFSVYKQALLIRQRCASEVEMDKAMEDSNVALGWPGQGSIKSEQKTILLEPDAGQFIWMQTILNYLPPPVCLFNMLQFATGFTALSGLDLCFVEPDPALKWRFKSLALLKDLDLPEFQKAMDAITSSLRILLSTSDNTQKDLFVDPLDRSFNDLWQTERKRLENAQLSLSTTNQKAFAIANFLIERKIFGSSPLIENLFKGAIKETMAQILRKPNSQEFTMLFQKNLRSLYSDLYILNKLKTLTPNEPFNWKILNQDQLPADAKYASVVFKPCREISAKGDKIQRQLRNLFDHNEIVDGQIPDFDEDKIWHDEIGMQGWMLRRAGRAGKYLFNRLYSQNRKHEAVTLFRDWLQTDQFLNSARHFNPDEAVLCLVLPGIQIDAKTVSIKEIILEVLEQKETFSSFRVESVITSEAHERAEAFDIIIIKKEENE